ncbi:MAG: ATP-dependent zinc metalloprotease FtsH [Spirochaetes bacterium]|nr:ATP-dependent zinc metalloprotease FtsH [Spirochaetota bacterium]
MNKTVKQIALIIIIGLLGYVIFSGNFSAKKEVDKLSYSDFVNKVEDNKIISVKIFDNRKIEGTYNKGENKWNFETVMPAQDPVLVPKLIEKGIVVDVQSPDDNMFLSMLGSFLPWLIFIGLIWFFMMRQVSSTGNKAMSFGKSRAKLHADTKTKVSFKDVAGIEEAKDELNEIVEFLKNPDKFVKIGAKIPKGVLLMGSPGTGKTLLARAIAGEAGVKFFSISGSDFVEMFVGVGASRVRDLFEQGKKSAPCIIFIDEIDAVGRLRGAGLGGGHDEREQTLNQLLVEMDGFEMNEGVIIIAATNRPDVLDPALLRPGRFDRQVVVPTPDVKGREKILAVHSRKIPLSKEVDLKVIARGTPGFTGADLANLVNEGALLAARKDLKRVSMIELEEAKDKVMMGPERRSMLITDEEKKITAYHEAGHAILGLMTDHGEDVHKVTIIPRGRALGVTMSLPKEEKYIRSEGYWLDQIVMLFGGIIAEKITFNETYTGASSDIERATAIARTMICEWGMSKVFGPMKMGKTSSQPFLGKELAHEKDYSEATAQKIDEEVHSILRKCEEKATVLIKNNIDKFNKIAAYLIERETLNAQEIKMIMNNEELPSVDEKTAETIDTDKLN